MFLKARRGLEKILGFGSALNEVVDRALRGAEPVGGLQCFGSLDLVATVWNVGDDASLDLSDIAVGGGRSGHHFLDDHPPDVVLSRSDVLHTLRNRPAIRSDLEIPLRIGKTLGRIEDIFSCGFEELQGLVLVCLRELLRPGRPATGHYKSATNNESQRSRNALHNLPFPQIGIRGSPKRFPEICEGHGEAARWRVECAPQAFRSEVIPYSKPVRRSLRGKGSARR